MRKLILQMAVSLDGMVADDGGGADWTACGAEPAVERWQNEGLSAASLHLMGSTTYWDMRAYWPRSTELMAGLMNSVPKAVVSRNARRAPAQPTKAHTDMEAMGGGKVRSTPDQSALASWDDVRWLQGELDETVHRLKRQAGGAIVAHGGSSFAAALVAAELVDEFRLTQHPVALGGGAALFSRIERQAAFERKACHLFDGGAVGLILRRI